MKTPVVDNRHVKEYIMYGIIAAVLYLLPVLYLLFANKYENLYLLFIGNALFMATIFYYAFYLITHPYDGKRAVSMLLAGISTTIVGTVVAALAVTILMFVFFPGLLSHQAPSSTVLADANTGSSTQYPSSFLFMILMDLVLGNVSVGVFASIITSYVNKRNQTKDKPADIENRVPLRNR